MPRLFNNNYRNTAITVIAINVINITILSSLLVCCVWFSFGVSHAVSYRCIYFFLRTCRYRVRRFGFDWSGLMSSAAVVDRMIIVFFRWFCFFSRRRRSRQSTGHDSRVQYTLADPRRRLTRADLTANLSNNNTVVCRVCRAPS